MPLSLLPTHTPFSLSDLEPDYKFPDILTTSYKQTSIAHQESPRSLAPPLLQDSLSNSISRKHLCLDPCITEEEVEQRLRNLPKITQRMRGDAGTQAQGLPQTHQSWGGGARKINKGPSSSEAGQDADQKTEPP